MMNEYKIKPEYDFSKGKRGAVIKTPPGKERITIRLDSEVLDWFRHRASDEGGGNYQTMINQALREHILLNQASFEMTLRRVIREELGKYGEETSGSSES